MARLFEGRANVPAPGAASARAADLSPERHPRGCGAALDRLLRGAARVQHREVPLHLRHPAAAGSAATEPAGLLDCARRRGRDADDAGPGVQHRRQLHHQHQLAVVRRRNDDELLRADDGADRVELHVGRGRHRGGHRARARLRAAGDARPSATSGWTSRGRPSTCSCRSRSWRRCCFVSQGVIQNWDPYTQVKTLEGATQTIAQGPVASQEAIKMLGTNGGGFFNANSSHPFENPTPFTTLLPDPPHLRAARRPGVHVRPHGQRHAAGLGALRRHERHVPDRRVRGLSRRTERQPDARTPGRRTGGDGRADRAATWKARKSASGSRSPRSSPR